jgi:hypothetical protein
MLSSKLYMGNRDVTVTHQRRTIDSENNYLALVEAFWLLSALAESVSCTS